MSYFWLLLLPLGPLMGTWLAIKSTRRYELQLKWFLSFAGSYLLAITLLNLIPEVFKVFDPYKGLLVLGGFFFQVFLEKFSEGIEHGHLHVHHHLKIKAIPIGIVASMSIHSFTEGIPVGSFLKDANPSFYSLLIGIVIHEIPAAFALVSILKGIQIKQFTLIMLGLIYSSMALLGSGMSILLEANIDTDIFDYFMAFVIGTFLHISTTILFESSEQHHFTRQKIIAVLLGIGVATLISVGI